MRKIDLTFAVQQSSDRLRGRRFPRRCRCCWMAEAKLIESAPGLWLSVNRSGVMMTAAAGIRRPLLK